MPQITSATATATGDGHGALMIAEMIKALTRCATVGVPKAWIVAAVASFRMLLTSATTTNCSPMSAAADDPSMT